MISLEDCIGFTGLPRAAILAVAEHERVPEIVATGIACRLLEQPDGCRRIGAMIADDAIRALHCGRRVHASELRQTLELFVRDHPEAMTSMRVRRCLDKDGPDRA